jgi:hypothetical protein
VLKSIKDCVKKLFNIHNCTFKEKPCVIDYKSYDGSIVSRYDCNNLRCKKTRLKIHTNGGVLAFDSKIPYEDRKDDFGRDPNYKHVFDMFMEDIKNNKLNER